ncbi:transglycosylase domain-containing protein [Calothrix sp. PCC 6303]|uniref:transglycosylase domain-containing protein n=1 Tax=Calothrix sp. PCC 6303 TaxID=1170562 RepID=UPI0002A05840|nr:penicillin-binding protein 1A [Calothrix sp. PCC 6303]AFZ04164.1 penicillin-binding protein, 1A family [Calothrix sp. PCC 6303]
MIKFTSWFKDKSTKLTDAKTSAETPEGEASPDELEDEKPPQGKAKQLLNRVGKVPSAILSKLPGSPKPLYRRYWFWAGAILTGGFVGVTSTISSIDKTLPSSSQLNSVAREQTLTIKAADGTILQQSGPATREQLSVDEIPEKLKQAFIASEDRRFLKHDGVDGQGIVRAVVNNLRSQNLVEGGSTITQQLARILFLKQEKTLLRKVREVRLAQKMERELSKDKILERYLNLVYLGSGAYGVADAAETYFSKPAKELTLAQMATIAGLAPAPSVYAPDRNPEAAKQRRNLVLQRMLEDGVITPEQKQEAISEPLTVTASQPKRMQVVAPYFTSFIQKELPNYVSQEVIEAGGLTVETTINPAWQELAENAVAKTLRNQGRWENFKQAALVAVDPRSGEIKVMVGGKDFGKNQFNRATQAKRQPGSTFKGFVYATAIATGMSPYQEFLDSPLIVDGYEPKNFDEGYRGSMDLRTAITKSINIVAVRILLKVGFDPIIQLAKKMGIKSELKPTYSLALGSSEVNLLEITSAYGSFATQGIHNEVHGITRVVNRQGEEVWKANFTPERALDEDSAKIMTWMLRNVVQNGTGSPAQLSDRAVAGKTGTTDEARDLWFIGYIPQLVTGVWLGNDNNNPTYGSSASAAYTWNQFMAKAVKGMPVEKFPERPKLEGRKASIKAEPVRGRRVVNRAIPDRDNKDNGNGEETPRRRRNRQETSSDSNTEQRSSRRRRRNSEETQETPRRRSRRSRSEESNSNSSSSESRSRRRVDSNSSSESRSRRSSGSSTNNGSGKSNSSGSSQSSGSSWRERLRPDAQ